MKIVFITVLLTILSFSLAGMNDIRFEYIDNKAGLSHNTVRYIIQDHQGLVWIATVNGLARYDGYTFQTFYPDFTDLSPSESNIRMMVEDKQGYLWVQTSSRYVNCYDLKNESFVDYSGRNEVRKYLEVKMVSNGDVWLWGDEKGLCHVSHHTNGLTGIMYDETNIGTDKISFVLEEQSGKIWIGTDAGLFQYIVADSGLKRVGIPKYDFHSAFDMGGYIYFLTNDAGIIMYDKKQKSFLPFISYGSRFPNFRIHHAAATDDNKIIISGSDRTLIFDIGLSEVYDAHPTQIGEIIGNASIIVDNNKQIWLYNRTGNLWRYNTINLKFEKINLIPESILSFIDLERYWIFTDSRGITWISTYGNGLFAIDTNGKIEHFTTANSDLRTNYLLFITEDRTGNLWVGTENAGIAMISFPEYDKSVLMPLTLRTNALERTIRSMFEDEQGTLWVGTKNGDIFVCDSTWEPQYLFSGKQKGIYAIQADKQKNIWVGTKGDGIRIFPADENYHNSYAYLLSKDLNAGENNIYAILCDQDGRMWIGTFGNGLFLAQWEKNQFQFRRLPSISDTQRQVRSLLQDSKGRIWAGGENGVVIFDPDTLLRNDKAFDWYSFDKHNPSSLNNNIVKTIFEDSQQQIWLGTAGGGVNLAVQDSESGKITFKHFTTENGLTNNIVQTLLEDHDHNLWISTESGLSKLNSHTLFFENYLLTDSWESDYFVESVALRRRNGDLLFGNYSGILIVNPDTFKKNNYSLPVILTGLSINGVYARPNSQESPLTVSIGNTKKLELHYNQNSFALEFSSLIYQNVHANRYTYILVNYDKEWNPITQYNIATYKNIPPGKYQFKVRCVTNSKDSEDTILDIVIKPPFWRSTQAIILYIITGLVLIYLTMLTLTKMNRLNNEIVIEKSITEQRLRFFTNISHEFRTPLTLILGSIESMYDIQLSTLLRKHLRILDKSSAKLLRLIDQLLEFRKLQHEELNLELEETDIVSFSRGIFEIFTEAAAKKQIDFNFSTLEMDRWVSLDRGKMEKIIFNLLSNAFKHTPEKGKIKLELVCDEDVGEFTIRVSDSGIGIPSDKAYLLFKRFKQINYTPTGIGIGLHLSAELAQAHHGRIEYSESEWGGACFTVTIPMITTLSDTQSPDKSSTPVKHQLVETISKDVSADVEASLTRIQTHKYKVLLIEDDDEISEFLEDTLKSFFQISVAANGLIGLELAGEFQPDLIVCDVMMPEMNGFELTRSIKNNFETSHIPIILLTAYASLEHQLEGIQAGADSYIVKPFSTKYLISRITKLIEQREMLQHKFAHEPGMLTPSINGRSEKDNVFMEKVHAVIEEHLDNPEFSIDDFAKEMNIGRTVFYKKIKGLTHYSPNEYIRIIRLKKATDLLKGSDLNIAEIAYRVGFNDPDYFSKCFKEQFGHTPRQFRTENIHER